MFMQNVGTQLLRINYKSSHGIFKEGFAKIQPGKKKTIMKIGLECFEVIVITLSHVSNQTIFRLAIL